MNESPTVAKELFADALRSIERERWEDARNSLHRARNIFLTLGDAERAAICALNLGAVLESLGLYSESLRFLKRARSEFESLNLVSSVAESYLNEGVVHESLEEYGEALEAYERARSLSLELDMVEQAAICDLNRAIIFESMDRFEEALRCYQTARAVFEATGMEEQVNACNEGIGRVRAAFGGGDARRATKVAPKVIHSVRRLATTGKSATQPDLLLSSLVLR